MISTLWYLFIHSITSLIQELLSVSQSDMHSFAGYVTTSFLGTAVLHQNRTVVFVFGVFEVL